MLEKAENDSLVLRKVFPADLDAVAQYREAFLAAGDSMAGCSFLRRYTDMQDWYAYICKAEHWETCPENFVPDTQFLCIRKQDNQLVGMLDIRHAVNDQTRLFGQIGYSVHPCERQKGYATTQLTLAKTICAEMGMKTVLISCHKDNVASVKVIARNGGILQSETMDERNGKALQLYQIFL